MEIGMFGWQAETEMDNEDDREGVYFLTIVADPGGDNEELATIVHRVCGGKYPLDGPLAMEKVRRAWVIVEALNNPSTIEQLFPTAEGS